MRAPLSSPLSHLFLTNSQDVRLYGFVEISGSGLNAIIPDERGLECCGASGGGGRGDHGVAVGNYYRTQLRGLCGLFVWSLQFWALFTTIWVSASGSAWKCFKLRGSNYFITRGSWPPTFMEPYLFAHSSYEFFYCSSSRFTTQTKIILLRAKNVSFWKLRYWIPS